MARLSLAPILDLSAAVPLRALLLAHRGQDLELDGSAVVRVGGQCLQVLLAAKRSWAAEGHRIRLLHPSDACGEALAVTHAGGQLGLED